MELPIVEFRNEGEYKIQLLTEGKIGKALDSDIDNSRSGDEIYIGMFYLGDKTIVKVKRNEMILDLDVEF